MRAARLVLRAVALATAGALCGCGGCGGRLAPGAAYDSASDAAADGARDATSSPGADAAAPVDARGADAPADGGSEASDGGFDAGLGCLAAAQDAAPVDDAATGCPPAPPVPGTPCDLPGYDCEYGTNWWSRCNLHFDCTGVAWHQTDYGPECPELDAGPAGGACPADTCPATWDEAAAIDGGPCPAFSCQYPEGACVCGVGTVCPEASKGWSCVPAATGCTYPRPRLGTPCDADASSYCQMGWACCDQVVECKDGVWGGNPLGVPCKQ